MYLGSLHFMVNRSMSYFNVSGFLALYDDEKHELFQ